MFSYKLIACYYPFKERSYLKFIKENTFAYFKY
jgi:hypothetical protein